MRQTIIVSVSFQHVMQHLCRIANINTLMSDKDSDDECKKQRQENDYRNAQQFRQTYTESFTQIIWVTIFLRYMWAPKHTQGMFSLPQNDGERLRKLQVGRLIDWLVSLWLHKYNSIFEASLSSIFLLAFTALNQFASTARTNIPMLRESELPWNLRFSVPQNAERYVDVLTSQNTSM